MRHSIFLFVCILMACSSSYEIEDVEEISLRNSMLETMEGSWKDFPTPGSGIAYSEEHGVFVLLSDSVLRKKKQFKTPLFVLSPADLLAGHIAEVKWLYASKAFDFEDLTFDQEGRVWMAEESIPQLVRYSFPELKKQKTLKPKKELPARFKRIQENRGFESVAWAGDALYALSQSPLKKKKEEPESFYRLLRYQDGTVAEFAYLTEHSIADTKIGALASLSDDELLALEHGTRADGSVFCYVFRLSLVEADELASLKLGEQLPSKIQTVEKTRILSLNDLGLNLHKPEGLEYVRSEHAIYITGDADDSSSTQVIRLSLKRSLLHQLAWW